MPIETMKEPQVTVIMSVYNSERYLQEAVESILNQTFADFEFIIIDDGSMDGTWAILSSYFDPRIQLVRNQENIGLPRSLNKGLALARGEYVARMDADDVALRERLDMQVNYLGTNPDVCLVGGIHQIINEAGDLEATHSMPTEPLAIRWHLLFGNCFSHSSVMFCRRQVLSVGGYDPTMLWAQDFDLFARLAARYQLANLEHPLTQWRRHTKNRSSSDLSIREECPVRAVIRSVCLQTGLEIDFATAKCLYRDISAPTEDATTIARAYQVILDALVVMLRKYAQTRLDQARLGQLALMDTYLLKSKHPGKVTWARQNAWRILQIIGPDLLITSGGWRCWLQVVLPQWFVSIIRSTKENLRIHVSSA